MSKFKLAITEIDDDKLKTVTHNEQTFLPDVDGDRPAGAARRGA